MTATLKFLRVREINLQTTHLEFLRIVEFADIFRVRPKTVYRWIHAQKITAIRPNVGSARASWRIPITEARRLAGISDYNKTVTSVPTNSLATSH